MYPIEVQEREVEGGGEEGRRRCEGGEEGRREEGGGRREEGGVRVEGYIKQC